MNLRWRVESVSKKRTELSITSWNAITFDDYFESLRECKETVIMQQKICSFVHNVYSLKQQKIGLSPYDDKRYIISDSTDTLPWGHYSILNCESPAATREIAWIHFMDTAINQVTPSFVDTDIIQLTPSFMGTVIIPIHSIYDKRIWFIITKRITIIYGNIREPFESITN